MSGPPLVYFDLETTGPDPWHDKIVEMAFWRAPALGYPAEKVMVERVNPRRPIPEGATAVHGISDDDVAHLPGFAHHADEVQRIVDGAVLVGYNIVRFDTIIIDWELRACGRQGLERDDTGRIVQPEIDLYAIWSKVEPRNLATAAMRFAGVNLEDAHSAGADTAVLSEVFGGMACEFDLPFDVEELAALSRPDGFVDRDGKFRRRGDGVVVFAFGKHEDQPVHSAPDYLSWMLGKDFSDEVKAFCRTFMEESASQRSGGFL